MPASSNLIPIVCIRHCRFVSRTFIACAVKRNRFEKPFITTEGTFTVYVIKKIPPSIRIVYLANI